MLISDDVEKTWYWQYKNYKLFYDVGEEVRAIVSDVIFKKYDDVVKASADSLDKLNKKANIEIENLMEIICSFNSEGLGPQKWWASS